jgi:hypothetical protein
MTDTQHDNTPALLVPDHRVVSIEEARAEKTKPRGIGRGSDWMTRADFDKDMERTLHSLNEQMRIGIARGVIATGEKLHTQWSEETAEFLEAMERDIESRILARIRNERRERSWVYRARRWMARARGTTTAPALAPPPLPAPLVVRGEVDEPAPAVEDATNGV